MREPKGTVGAVKAMKHDSSPTRAMRDPKGTAGAGEEMKQRREMLKVGYQQSPHFAMDDDSRSIDHWRKFFDNTGLDIFELIENAVYVARMDYPKEFISKQQTKNFVDPSQDHVNPSMLDEEIVSKRYLKALLINLANRLPLILGLKTKQPKKEINQASLERAKRKLKEGYQQAEIDKRPIRESLGISVNALVLRSVFRVLLGSTPSSLLLTPIGIRHRRRREIADWRLDAENGDPRESDLHGGILDSGEGPGHRSSRIPPPRQLLLPRSTWRSLLIIASAPGFLLMLGVQYAVESPRWLCKVGRLADAESVIYKLWGEADVNNSIKEIQSVTKSELYSPKTWFDLLVD
ncbi:hypothetical protein HPP92_012176 [Vanilla planifolia]|uniref:Uncharacterized protein n=1 Tax=Vanilla planifolia TaxID=51239 RepID=A0A835R0G9_VANPL|nr:hypothetical protein HPP92_012176 [Vanilla planifolia]